MPKIKNAPEIVYITPSELADWLSCSTRHIYNMAECGLIKPRYFGGKKLYHISEVEKMIETSTSSN